MFTFGVCNVLYNSLGSIINDEIENYEPAEPNTLLEHFYAEVNNTKDYESDSLT